MFYQYVVKSILMRFHANGCTEPSSLKYRILDKESEMGGDGGSRVPPLLLQEYGEGERTLLLLVDRNFIGKKRLLTYLSACVYIAFGV